MLMSPDVVAMIIALFAFSVTVLGGVSAMLTRQSHALEARFDKVDARFEKVDDRFDQVHADIVDTKVAIARLEGPAPRLQRP
ncbi:hypothetical protein [Microbacterium sp. XT11]|uniref:hypothetical protein n=1 Tax=Microbacterium sp. XT11 TaxID=367477 RepID=UPI0012FAD672|nr:hypothetical protein [Microbacterium sp. XT11]